MLNNVNVNKGASTSGRTAPGSDYYSGVILYGTAPVVSGKWLENPGPPAIKTQQMFSVADIAASGIVPYSDNAASTGTLLITTKGNTDEVIEIFATVPNQLGAAPSVISLGVYKVLAGSTTIAAQGADIAVEINKNTPSTGWSASFNTATLTLLAPKKYGISLNSGTPYSYSTTGVFVATVTQNVIAGTKSPHSLWDYHIRQYFQKNPTGNLRVGIIAATSAFDETVSLQKASGGILRFVGVYDDNQSRASAANITGTILQLQNAAQKIYGTNPFYCVYSPNITAISDLSTYPNQNLNTANNVCCIISQDGDAEGALLYVRNGQSVGHIGAKLGTFSKKRPSASDAQPIPDFNLSDGVENNVPAFANGVLSANVTENLQSQLDNYRYTFVRQFAGETTGTFWTDNKSCVTAVSDYAFENDNSTFSKVSRILRTTFIPRLSSEIVFNTDGTLQDYVVQSFKTDGEEAVENAMVRGLGSNPMIGGIELDIDPTQDVRASNNLTVNATVVQNGIARTITVNIAYGTIN